MTETVSRPSSAARTTPSLPREGGIERFGVRPIDVPARSFHPRDVKTVTPRGEISMFLPSFDRKPASVMDDRVVSRAALRETRPVWTASKEKSGAATGKEGRARVTEVTIFQASKVNQPELRLQQTQQQEPQPPQFRTAKRTGERKAQHHTEQVGKRRRASRKRVRYPEAREAQVVQERQLLVGQNEVQVQKAKVPDVQPQVNLWRTRGDTWRQLKPAETNEALHEKQQLPEIQPNPDTQKLQEKRLARLEKTRVKRLEHARGQLKTVSEVQPRKAVASVAEQKQQQLERVRNLEGTLVTLKEARAGKSAVHVPEQVLQEKMVRRDLQEVRKLLRKNEKIAERKPVQQKPEPRKDRRILHVRDEETNQNLVQTFEAIFANTPQTRKGVHAWDIVARMPAAHEQPVHLRSKLIRYARHIIEPRLEHAKHYFSQLGVMKSIDDVRKGGIQVSDKFTAVEHNVHGETVSGQYVRRFVTAEDPEPLPQTQQIALTA